MADKRGIWQAQCSKIRFCYSCRIFSICKGNKKYLRTQSLDYDKIDLLLNDKPLYKGDLNISKTTKSSYKEETERLYGGRR